MMTDISEALIKIRQLIATGWCQGTYHQVTNETPEYCLAGAIDRIGYHINDIRAHIVQRLGVANLANWNDDPSRTKEEVLALLDEVIRAN